MCAGEAESADGLRVLKFPVMSAVIFKLTRDFSAILFFDLDTMVQTPAYPLSVSTIAQLYLSTANIKQLIERR